MLQYRFFLDSAYRRILRDEHISGLNLKSTGSNISDNFDQVPTQLGATERTIISINRVGVKERSF